ncbi:DinB family protein [uncultured Dokdonia sp.]|uniref:DinB family protein n=1 Tax=uncultured Dokdonia sp. TaxID=575653 RepID=UPI002632CEEA|nr:DinB family protein [uncultured Dokdonia sp.]
MNQVIQHIIQQYKEVQHGKLWIGSTFTSKLNQVDTSMVFKRPITGLHSIAEIISHLTLWRKETILKIQTGTGSKTDDCEENWLPNDQLAKKGWLHIKSEYDNTLSELIDLLASKDDDFLNTTYYDTDFKDTYEYRFVINGMLHHDLYHLGQLGIIIKYLKEHNTPQ